VVSGAQYRSTGPVKTADRAKIAAVWWLRRRGWRVCYILAVRCSDAGQARNRWALRYSLREGSCMCRLVVIGIAALSVMLGTAATADACGYCGPAYTTAGFASDACCPTETTSCDPCVYRETYFPRIYRARFCAPRCTPVSCCPDPCGPEVSCPDPCETTGYCPPGCRPVRFRRAFFRDPCCPTISCPTIDPCDPCEGMIEEGSGETLPVPESLPEEEQEPPPPTT